MPNRFTTPLAVTAIVLTAGVGGAVVLSGDEQSRQAEVRERGAAVMPFSLDATTHTFKATPAGGVQTVVAKDPADVTNIRLIREHLREEASAFERGDFGDPATIHGDEMPGLRELAAGYRSIAVDYRRRADGAALTYRTADPSIARALSRWFDAQLGDHGRDARRSEAPERAHTDHARHPD